MAGFGAKLGLRGAARAPHAAALILFHMALYAGRVDRRDSRDTKIRLRPCHRLRGFRKLPSSPLSHLVLRVDKAIKIDTASVIWTQRTDKSESAQQTRKLGSTGERCSRAPPEGPPPPAQLPALTYFLIHSHKQNDVGAARRYSIGYSRSERLIMPAAHYPARPVDGRTTNSFTV
ncbi:hypothetical protein EVAR_44059_1 [Eumeta japonica]|uniref:Uncharacterized protein n=1 Tax=Eumeta variegata TaxID=151549 RepID=A0A4C1X252_EUMVA|nr:hypothetical protein EVAR_44059_1 [Eumeta japonica]